MGLVQYLEGEIIPNVLGYLLKRLPNIGLEAVVFLIENVILENHLLPETRILCRVIRRFTFYHKLLLHLL